MGLYHHNEDGLGWPKVTIYIDNEEIVNRGNRRYPKFRNVRQYLAHDYDLWLTTSDLLSSINLRVNFEWVRGHQSVDENNENIQAILLNTEVDRMATDQYNKNRTPPHRGAFHSGVVCYHQQGYHVQKIQNAISSRESDASLIDYYTGHGWRTSDLERVDWKNLETFLKRCHPIERCNTIQLMHDWQNTGAQQRKFSHNTDTNNTTSSHLNDSQSSNANIGDCIFDCGHVETPFHYMQCRSDLLFQARTKGRERLDRDLYKMQTAPSLTEAILQGIACWEDGTEFELGQSSNKFLFNEVHTKLLESQANIGWERFLKGYISKDWGRIQEQYYSHANIIRKKKYTRNNWVLHLLRSLHEYRNSIWKVRNQVVHGGATKDQRMFKRKQMQRTITKLYRKDRSAIPINERYVFNLPLTMRKKQGNQQLRLWIERTQLLFETYNDVPVREDQQQSITHWLQEWSENSTTPLTASMNARDKNANMMTDSISTDDEDDTEVRSQFSQMNISNWLKSWGQERVHSSDARNLSTQDSSYKSTQSEREVQSDEHLSGLDS